jgi:hypothetical protein
VVVGRVDQARLASNGCFGLLAGLLRAERGRACLPRELQQELLPASAPPCTDTWGEERAPGPGGEIALPGQQRRTTVKYFYSAQQGGSKKPAPAATSALPSVITTDFPTSGSMRERACSWSLEKMCRCCWQG